MGTTKYNWMEWMKEKIMAFSWIIKYDDIIEVLKTFQIRIKF